VVPTELLVVMLVEQVGATPTVAALAAERVTAHSSSGLALVLGPVGCWMLVVTVPGQVASMMVS